MERNDVIVMLCIGLGLPVLVCILSSRGHRHGMDRGEHVHPDHLPEGVIDNSADPVSAGEGESVRQFAASIPPQVVGLVCFFSLTGIAFIHCHFPQRIYVRSRTGPQSAHLWWPAVAKLQAASVPTA